MEAINDKNNSESKNSFFLILFFALYCVLAGVSTELTLFYNAKEVTGEYIFLALGSAILSIVLGILFSLFFVKKKKFAIDKIFLIISALMFVGNTIALLSFPSSLTITDNFTFSSPFSFRMVLVISGLSTSVFIYNFYSFFCLLKQGKKSFSFIARVIVILTIEFSIY